MNTIEIINKSMADAYGFSYRITNRKQKSLLHLM